MPETSAIHTTADGWTISADQTPARHTALFLRCANGDERAVAKLFRTNATGLRRRLQDDRLPNAPRVPAAAAAILAAPLPVVCAPEPGCGGEADIIRLCHQAVTLEAAWGTLDRVRGDTLYDAPAAYSARTDDLWNLMCEACEAAAAIPATTLAGLRAKAQAVRASTYDGHFWRNDPLLMSLLADASSLPA